MAERGRPELSAERGRPQVARPPCKLMNARLGLRASDASREMGVLRWKRESDAPATSFRDSPISKVAACWQAAGANNAGGRPSVVPA